MNLRELYFLGSKIGGPAKPAIKWLLYRVLFDRIERNAVLTNSIPKSGTNKFRILLANYVYKFYVDRNFDVTYGFMDKNIFRFSREDYLQTTIGTYRAPDKFREIFDKAPFSDSFHSHTTRFLEYSRGKIIFIYRNPLDYLVSYYFNQYEYRHRPGANIHSISDVIEPALDGYIVQLKQMREIAKKKPVLTITYEQMIREPNSTFQIVLEWLNLPIDIEILEDAIRASDISVVRKEEEASGPIHSVEGFSGFFTRSGEIGQWKKHLSKEDVDKVYGMLAKNDLNICQFRTE